MAYPFCGERNAAYYTQYTHSCQWERDFRRATPWLPMGTGPREGQCRLKDDFTKRYEQPLIDFCSPLFDTVEALFDTVEALFDTVEALFDMVECTMSNKNRSIDFFKNLFPIFQAFRMCTVLNKNRL